MSISFLSPNNDFLPPQPPSFNSSIFNNLCADYFILLYTTTISNITNIVLVLPPSVFVLYLGLQRWKQQRSSAAVMSHSDFFTYNMAVMELIGILGYTVSNVSGLIGLPEIVLVGVRIGGFPWSAQMFFPILVCLERYLAVVHPITYMKLKQGAGVRIRYISTVSIWLACFAGVILVTVSKNSQQNYIGPFCLMAFSIFTVTFCSFSILCILIRPRPGEVGGDRVRVDQSKRRAFQTVVIIMGVLLVRFEGNLAVYLGIFSTANDSVWCLLVVCTAWFNLPSSLVLPLLFLHREGKLPGCKHSTEDQIMLRSSEKSCFCIIIKQI